MSRRRIVHALCLGAFAATVLASTRAPADVQEQRARLPPPARDCPDPIEGVWMSHEFNPEVGQWYRFRLTIHRKHAAPNELEGQIDAEFWDGTRDDASPPRCAGGFHFTVVEPARGSVVGQQIQFGGTSWRLGQVFCGPSSFAYNLDVFRGTIDPALLEFQSILDDGDAWVNVHAVFRRVHCLEPDAVPRPIVRAPPFQPPSHAFGCGS